MANNKKQEVLFGTGDLYVLNDDAELDLTQFPNEEDIEAVGFKVGESNGEAALTLEQEFVDVRGGVKNNILRSMRTSETITFNAGFVTYDMESIHAFLASKFENDSLGRYRKLELGGDVTVPINKLLFVHTKEDGKKLYMMMHKAQNRAGLEWTFNAEEETAFNFEFTLLKDTSKSNIVEIIEELIDPL